MFITASQINIHNPSMKSFLLYIIIELCINIWCSTSVSSMGNETDRLALVAFKDGITKDPLGVLSSWNDSLHYCRWTGVYCSHRHVDRVSELNLWSYGLVGSLSPHIGNLTFLRRLILQNNSFHGEVPAEVGGLFRLRVLELSNNSIEGTIPVNLTNCLDLEYLNLIDNHLKGEIPAEIGSLYKLQTLGLSANYFTGRIPASLGNLSRLLELSISENSLEGSIPEELGRITRVEFFQLGLNKLTGTIPSSLYNISAVSYFQVSANQLEGNIHPDIFLSLPRLSKFYAQRNRFTGPIPLSLSNASNLEAVQLSRNNFTGTLPWELGRLQNLEEIIMAWNQLGSTGGDDLRFIHSLANCTQLQYLTLDHNFLAGSLVSSIANLSTQVVEIDLGSNQIHGAIPEGIENLVNLNVLLLNHNHLTGNIPPNIGKLQKLQLLYLSRNKFSGRIPASLGNLTVLNYLYLRRNNLSGEIPPDLAACKRLLGLTLSNNALTGSIPKEIMGLSSLAIILNLRNNTLTGSLPPEVGNLVNLEDLDVSNNRLSGDLPSTLGECVTMRYLRLGNNFFQGKIPTSLQSLRGIDYLDFSRNNFSGPVPAHLGELPFLTFLNLSFNEFEGEVPKTGAFGNASVISLQGNYGLCGGIPELNLPICPTPSVENKKNLVVKVIIPVVTATSCSSLLAVLFVIRHRRRKSRKNVSSAQLYNSQFRRISYSDLYKATGGFCESNIIGAGSYGTVYKGVLEQDGTAIAIKVFKLRRRGASKSFMSECKALRKIRHRNLVKILSACSSFDLQGNDFKAIVFELMPQGTLEGWLHPQIAQEDAPQKLNLLQRLNIAIDVASALEYLHSHCDGTIVHSDLKPSNILLDEDMTAHLSDFGLAKIISMISSTASTYTNQSSSNAIMKGSIGYIAPEYGVSCNVSTEGDVYSYGILLLEMFTGRRPTDDMFHDGLTLHTFVKSSLPEGAMEVIDPGLLLEEDGREHKIRECIISVLSNGITCSAESPRDRLEIGDVVKKLQSIRNLFLQEASHGEGEGPSCLIALRV